MTGTVRGLTYLFWGDRLRWSLLALLVVVTSAMEALAAALVFAFVDLLSTGTVDLPLLGSVTTAGGGLPVFAAGVAAAFVLRTFLVLLHDLVLYRLCYGGGADLEERLLRGYLSLPPREIRRRGHAELVRNVHDTVMTVVEEALLPCVLAVGTVLRTTGVIVVMAFVAPVPTLLAGVVFGPVLWLLSRAVRRPVRRLGEQVESSLASSLRAATETLSLAGEIQSAGRAADFGNRFGTVRRDLARAAGTEEVIRSVPRLTSEMMLVLFVIGYVAYASFTGTQATVLPTLGLFAYAALRVLPSLIGLVGLVHSIALSAPALETVLADLPLARAGGRSPEPQPAPQALALRGVTVRIPETGRAALHGIDLELRRGDVVAVVGPNGAGKSTLIDVLAGVLLPDAGVVAVDGVPVQETGRRWPSQVAMVPQHVHLLDTDVPTNITLDLSGASASDPRLAEVIRDVGLEALVDRLAGGSVGEDGRTLSGGERQRIAVARALYRAAGVLLVDEGTSALDAAARTALLDLITVHRAERITVLVTHDPELASACTRTVRIEKGRLHVVEETSAAR